MKIKSIQGNIMTKMMEHNYKELELVEMSRHRLILEEYLVKTYDLNIRDKESKNALYWAIKFRHKHNTELLLKHKSSLMVTHDMHALFHTVESNDIDTFVHLLELDKNNMNITYRNNQTLLMKAIIEESVPMVRYLINHGANLYVKDDKKKTALDYAKEAKVKEVYDLVHYRILYETLCSND